MNTITNDYLINMNNRVVEMAEKYQKTGQVEGLKYLMFLHKTLEKEFQLIEMGIDRFVYESDIIKYIEEISDKSVKITELKYYKREIPSDIVSIIENTKGIFDELLVVFTDYTEEFSDATINEQIEKEKDPILFGVFYNEETGDIVERYYFLGDWVDEYCDLTLDKMIAETMDKTSENIEHGIKEISKFGHLENFIRIGEKKVSLFHRLTNFFRKK